MTRKQTDALWAEMDKRLDEALRDTFPASDPLSIEQPTAIGVPERRDREFVLSRRRLAGGGTNHSPSEANWCDVQ